MKLLSLLLLASISIIGCAASIDSVDTKGKNQDCVRQCTGVYSACIGNALGIAAQNNCASGYRACANTCPVTK